MGTFQVVSSSSLSPSTSSYRNLDCERPTSIVSSDREILVSSTGYPVCEVQVSMISATG